MKLADWLAGDPKATPPRPRTTYAAFAARIGGSATLITGYCNGSVWPGKEKMEAIIRETGGDVTANDFLQGQPAEAAQ